MVQSRPPYFRLVLAWLLFVPLMTIWNVVQYNGLYRLLCEWDLAEDGQYDATRLAIFPALLLVAPAFLVIRYRWKTEADLAPAPVTAVRKARTIGAILMLGSASAAIAVWAGVSAARISDGSPPRATVDLARLGDARPPLGSVVLSGVVDLGHSVSKTVWMRFSTGPTYHYYPVVAPGAAGAPVRFFSRGWAPLDHDKPWIDKLSPNGKMTGVLVENALPGDMVRELERRNIAVASPHYLLFTNPEDARANDQATAILCGILAVLALGIAAAVRMVPVAQGSAR
jgi:hypothetical protein